MREGSEGEVERAWQVIEKEKRWLVIKEGLKEGVY